MLILAATAARFKSMTNVMVLTAVVIVAGGLPASQAAAQTSRPDRQTQGQASQEQEQKAEKPGGLLAGPTVKEADSETGGPASMTRQRPGQQMPLQVWLRQLRSLGLDRSQSRAIQPLIEEHQKLQRAFQQEHGSTLRELRQQMRDARRDGGQPDPKIRQEIERLQQMAPKPETLQEAIWEQLTEPQQEQMLEQINAWRERREAAIRARQQSDRASDQPGAMTDQAQSQPDDAMTDRARRDGTGEDAGIGTDRPIRDRIRERLDRARSGDAGDRDTLQSDNLDIDLDLSDLDANARKRLRFLRALQQKRSGRG